MQRVTSLLTEAVHRIQVEAVYHESSSMPMTFRIWPPQRFKYAHTQRKVFGCKIYICHKFQRIHLITDDGRSFGDSFSYNLYSSPNQCWPSIAFVKINQSPSKLTDTLIDCKLSLADSVYQIPWW